MIKSVKTERNVVRRQSQNQEGPETQNNRGEKRETRMHGATNPREKFVGERGKKKMASILRNMHGPKNYRKKFMASSVCISKRM